MPLRLEKRKGSGIWRVRGSHHGIVIDKSARTRSRAEAEGIRESWEREIYDRVIGKTSKQKNHRFADAAESWLLSGGNSSLYFYFDKVVTALADKPLADVTQGYLDRTARTIFPTQKPSTINRGFYALVSVILSHASDERMMAPMRVKKQKTQSPRINWQPPHIIEKLISGAGDMAPMIIFYIGTGARTAEACRLDWVDVSPAGERVTFWTTKSGRARSVDLCDRTLAALPNRSKGRVWRGGNGQPWAETGDGRFYGPKQRLQRICEREGLPNIGIHSLRHSWASWQYALNPDPIALMTKGGWSSLSMVMKYTHLGTNDLADEVRAHGWFQDEKGQFKGNFSL